MEPGQPHIKSDGKSKTILIIDNSIDITGAIKSVTRSAFDLRDSFNFKFLVPRKSKARFWIHQVGFKVVFEMPMLELSKRILSLIFYVPLLVKNGLTLRRIVKHEKIDLIHVNDLYNLLPLMIRVLGNPTPYVCHIRFLPDRFPKPLLNFWLSNHLRYSEKIIVVSESVKRQLPDHPKIIVIHNELPNEEKYEGLAVERKDTGFTFLYLANYIQGKGQVFAIEAFSRVHGDLPGWKLRFVGSDMGLNKNRKYKQELIATAHALNIDEKIEWAGFTNDVELEYRQGDIVLNFSESESFSITCLEAMYFGRPLIATDCGGPAEIIDHLETGILVQNRDINAMSKAMLTLAADEGLRNRIAAQARLDVRKKYSVEKTSFKLKAVYNGVSKI